ncbi:MAG: FAD-dependent oxidoreductase [Cytophagales bacterium]|nr:FAD-dependent oxidoreductase [Cytophagales bacterium]
MKRRDFLKISSLALFPWTACTYSQQENHIPIKVLSDHKIGHLVWKSIFFPKERAVKKHDILIVGGGIAGLSSAYQLQDKDFILCEASENLGGTSSAYEYEGMPFAQGAHYDLSYPQNYGREFLNMLSSLNLINYNQKTELWDFTDTQHLIHPSIESRAFVKGEFYDDVITDKEFGKKLHTILDKYENQVPSPTRLINKKLHHLNEISFLDFLRKEGLNIPAEFVNQIDYHMMDDYGGTAQQVSALAGIHYYKCRPYSTKKDNVKLFSPPQGNHYFIEKISKNILHKERLLCQRLVKKITPLTKGFSVEVINAQSQKIEQFEVNKVIYAGTKHALKYVYPQDHHLFKNNEYAPWLVVNLVLPHQEQFPAYWQNEILSNEKAFMGFVNSHSQLRPSDSPFQVLTSYYCFQPDERKKVLETLDNPRPFVENTIEHISNYYDEDIRPYIIQAFIKGIGHAMAIPKPYFLLNDQNQHRSHENLVYAGVDNGRIPIFPEAVDSGILASNLIHSPVSI